MNLLWEYNENVNVIREHNEMKDEIVNPKYVVEQTIQKQWEPIPSVVIKIQQTKLLVLEELDRID